MKESILRIAEKYSFESIVNQINDIEQITNIEIGFLGEFNSGKSTLINAMIGEQVLPAMECHLRVNYL